MTDETKECDDLKTRIHTLDKQIAVLEERLRGADKALESALKQYPTQSDSIALKADVDKKIAESTGWVKVVSIGAAFASIVTLILQYAQN